MRLANPNERTTCALHQGVAAPVECENGPAMDERNSQDQPGDILKRTQKSQIGNLVTLQTHGKAATRDGAPVIELTDGKELCDLSKNQTLVRSSQLQLSKSKFVAGIQCLKRLYLQVHSPDLAAVLD